MKAVYFEKTGAPEVLNYGDFPDPGVSSGETLIRVKACGINPIDIWQRKGKVPSTPMPHILGGDIAGIEEETGRAVVVNPAISCGQCPRCRTGELCQIVLTLGRDLQGGYAEQVKVPASQVYSKPEHLSFSEAAAFPLTFLTAWHMLVGRANLKKGETVFIWGGTGGLGIAAIQIARDIGARIITAVGSDESAKKAKALGADHAVLYSSEDVLGKVKELTRETGADVVFETVGKETWDSSLSMLRPQGRLVFAGTTSGNIITQNLTDIYVRQLTLLGSRMGYKEEFEKVLERVNERAFKPVIDRTFLLSQAKQAHEYCERRGRFGKVVLEVDS